MSIFKKHRKIKESSISGREKEYTREELNDVEKKLYDYLRSNKFYEYGDVEQSDNDLADMRIIMTIENGDWKHDHLYADQLIQDFCKENNLAIIKHIKKEIGYSDSDSYSAEHTWYILDDSTGKMADTVKGFKRLFEPVESLKEDAEETTDIIDAVPEPAKDGEDTIVANFVIAAISDEWEAIDGYNELLSVLTQYNQPDLISTIKDIVAEEMTHVGQLEKCLETISPNVAEIESGKEEAEQEIQEN